MQTHLGGALDYDAAKRQALTLMATKLLFDVGVAEGAVLRRKHAMGCEDFAVELDDRRRVRGTRHRFAAGCAPRVHAGLASPRFALQNLVRLSGLSIVKSQRTQQYGSYVSYVSRP